MKIARWALLLALCLGTPVQAEELVQRIVVFDEAVASAQRLNIIKDAGGKIVHNLWLINAVAARFPAAKIGALEARLLSQPQVARIDPDFEQKWIEESAVNAELPPVKHFIIPFKAALSAAKGATMPWGVVRVGADKIWAATRGAGIKVAVIDTGVDPTHPDLEANLKGGWSAVDKANPNNWKDGNGHGSHVAGTIAAVRGGAANGVMGVAPEASLYAVQVLNAQGSGTFADVIAGMQWAVENKMDLANMSLGASQGNPSLADAAKKAHKAGVAIIAAAGNSGAAVGFPAAYPEILAISAMDNADKLANFSSRGPEVDFIAPGVNVPSTYMNGGYRTLSGTSMACPHAAGVAALVMASQPGVRGTEPLRAALKKVSTTIAGLKPTEQGAGMPDVRKLAAIIGGN